jgi:hypothetical protein
MGSRPVIGECRECASRGKTKRQNGYGRHASNKRSLALEVQHFPYPVDVIVALGRDRAARRSSAAADDESARRGDLFPRHEISSVIVACIHLYRGSYQNSWLSQGGHDPIAEILLGEIAVDDYFLEYDDERSGGFAATTLPAERQQRSARPRKFQIRQTRSQGCAHAPLQRSDKDRPA